MIIYILFQVSITKAIKSQLTKPSKRTDKKLTFKMSRAKKQHKETLKLIEEMKKKSKTKPEDE